VWVVTTFAAAAMLIPSAAAAVSPAYSASHAKRPPVSHTMARAERKASEAAPATPTCNSQGVGYCDYALTGGRDFCFWWDGSLANWNSLPNSGNQCRNVDESIYVEAGGYLRLYYSPNYGGAHVCIDPFDYISNLSGYRFNSGSGAGLNQPIENNVASSSWDGNRCTNPI
jgi:hypothetical protein